MFNFFCLNNVNFLNINFIFNRFCMILNVCEIFNTNGSWDKLKARMEPHLLSKPFRHWSLCLHSLMLTAWALPMSLGMAGKAAPGPGHSSNSICLGSSILFIQVWSYCLVLLYLGEKAWENLFCHSCLWASMLGSHPPMLMRSSTVKWLSLWWSDKIWCNLNL